MTYSLDGSEAEGATLGIAVIGELPYAEGIGDRADLSLDTQDVAVVKNLKSAGIPVVVLLISGRPLIVNKILPQTDALLAAFLPGTEGQGIADVLFGDYNPTGKLSFSWPRSNDQLPLNINMPEEDYDPLFALGHGLSYQKVQSAGDKTVYVKAWKSDKKCKKDVFSCVAAVGYKLVSSPNWLN